MTARPLSRSRTWSRPPPVSSHFCLRRYVLTKRPVRDETHETQLDGGRGIEPFPQFLPLLRELPHRKRMCGNVRRLHGSDTK